MSKPTALGAYVFAGGFTLGVKKHFDVQCVFEETPYGVATARRNQPEIPVHVGFENWELPDARVVDFVYGNPPCAAWSQAGSATKKGRTWDTSDLPACTLRHFSLLEKYRPHVWAWESVQRAWTLGRDFVDDLARRARDMGYSTTIFLHDAQYLGAPQRRQRFFMIAHDVELDFARPAWETTTIDEALRGINDRGEPLDKNCGKVAWLLPHVRQGENLSSAFTRWHEENKKPLTISARGQVVGRPPFTIKRARAGVPAPVVMHELIHPTEDRALSLLELAILCGYPPMHEFVGANDAGQIGRGVCPPVGEYLARNVARAIKRGQAVTVPAYRVVDYTNPPGAAQALNYEEEKPAVAKKIPHAPDTRHAWTGKPETGEGSGAFIRRMLGMGMETDQILATVHANFPNSKATSSDVSWNRNRMRKEGTAIPKAKTQNTPPQPLRTQLRTGTDPNREFDRTSLRKNAHGKWVHRDYGAHFFRWGFAARYSGPTVDVLDVGCGPDCSLVDVLTMPRSSVPRSYVGVDVNPEPRSHPSRQWAEFKWEFDFTRRHKELKKTFNLITCFEVIEHMRPDAGSALLAGIRDRLDPDGVALLSTPVFDGKAAANHLHEWTIPELEAAIIDAGLVIEKRYGTFASWNAVKKVAMREELRIADALRDYYSGEVVACFLAPLYPDASRNCVWKLRRSGKNRRKKA